MSCGSIGFMFANGFVFVFISRIYQAFKDSFSKYKNTFQINMTHQKKKSLVVHFISLQSQRSLVSEGSGSHSTFKNSRNQKCSAPGKHSHVLSCHSLIPKSIQFIYCYILFIIFIFLKLFSRLNKDFLNKCNTFSSPDYGLSVLRCVFVSNTRQSSISHLLPPFSEEPQYPERT